MGIFFIDGTNATNVNKLFQARASVYMWQQASLDSFQRPSLNKIFRRFCPDERSTCKFTLTSTRSVEEAISGCNDALADYIRERRGPTIVCAQGSGAIQEARHWRSMLSQLTNFPMVIVPANSKDSVFAMFGWQQRLCNLMIQRFMFFPDWYEDRLGCARYAHIPLGNLGNDVTMTMADVLFARQLEYNRHLLWAAEGPLPDLGGSENDLQNVWSDILTESIIQESGVYRSACVELEVFGLVVGAIMGSSILDAEGITSVGSKVVGDEGPATASMISNDASCARAFNLLKGLVTKWISDIGFNGDLHADALLLNLYRYLCTQGITLLNDPTLHRIIFLLMKKIFRRLIAEFRKLGVKIIYADFYRVIICTGRRSLSSAMEYTNFITDAISNNELFHFLQINEKKYWEQLIWLDSENWEGLSFETQQAGDADDDGAVEFLNDNEAGDDQSRNVVFLDIVSKGKPVDVNGSANIGGERDADDNVQTQVDKLGQFDDEEDDIVDKDDEVLDEHGVKLGRKKEFDFLDEDEEEEDTYPYNDNDNDDEPQDIDSDAPGNAAPQHVDDGIEAHWDLSSYLPEDAAVQMRLVIGKITY
jgi:hypothetical protein